MNIFMFINFIVFMGLVFYSFETLKVKYLIYGSLNTFVNNA